MAEVDLGEGVPNGMYSAEGDPWKYRINAHNGVTVVTAIKPDGSPVFLEPGMTGKNAEAYAAIMDAVKSGRLIRTGPTEKQTRDIADQRAKYDERQNARENSPEDAGSTMDAVASRVKELGSSALESAKSGASRFADVVRSKMAELAPADEPQAGGMKRISDLRQSMEDSDLSTLSPREKQYFIDAIKSRFSTPKSAAEDTSTEEAEDEEMPPAAKRPAMIDTNGDGKPDSEVVAVSGRK